ncbi:MAG: polysaccharide pyruvyl transferase family protein [Parvularculaceae bacterium]
MATGRFRTISLLHTSVASTNVGDEIIMAAVDNQLAPVLGEDYVNRIASHERMSSKSRGMIAKADYAIAGGSNLLSSHAGIRSVWKLTPFDATLGKKFVMMGVGWYHDQGAPDPYTAWLYKSLFSREMLHSVRDNYSKEKLNRLGFSNVVNTGCPTLWELPDDINARIPHQKSENVVTTLNTYMKDRAADAALLEILKRKYRRVFAWVQTYTDEAYLKDLFPDIELIAPNLAAYDALLASGSDLDYVGNRLHAGIRALQKGRRTVIIEIDNRAREMGRDFHLPTVARNDWEGLERMIDGPTELRIALPRETIRKWLDQWK